MILHHVMDTIRTRLVDYNGNYIQIGIGIIRNKRCYNVILITIHLFGDNIIVRSQIVAQALKSWGMSPTQ